jgi:tRNA(adenine34) deaminase
MDQWATETTDRRMMRRCIELASIATTQGEFPFASLICSPDGTVVAEAMNRVARDKDVTRHAELLAVSEAQKVLGQAGLSGCTVYSNIEPCVMCSFPIRESRISRVVFGLRSPMMGGFSRWNVLGDRRVCEHMPECFSPPPDVLAGFLAEEAEKVWADWSPEIWAIIKTRGCFEAAPHAAVAPPRRSRRGARASSGSQAVTARQLEQQQTAVPRRF